MAPAGVTFSRCSDWRREHLAQPRRGSESAAPGARHDNAAACALTSHCSCSHSEVSKSKGKEGNAVESSPPCPFRFFTAVAAKLATQAPPRAQGGQPSSSTSAPRAWIAPDARRASQRRAGRGTIGAWSRRGRGNRKAAPRAGGRLGSRLWTSTSGARRKLARFPASSGIRTRSFCIDRP